jgi:proteasome lid subunit RPN8/RPN11
MLEAVRDQMHLGLEVLAVYHSHPTSPPLPSKKDLARNYSEDVISMIISLARPDPVVRAWWLTETAYREAEWQVV